MAKITGPEEGREYLAKLRASRNASRSKAASPTPSGGPTYKADNMTGDYNYN